MELEEFTKKFLKGRINWWIVPRLGVTNFGSIISMVLYRKAPFQVELFIVPEANSSFTNHRHPNVDTYEFPLSGEHMLYFDEKPVYYEEDMKDWVKGLHNTGPLHILPEQFHSGKGVTPYAFLSIQKWLNGVEPSSVGFDWIGEPSSTEHETLLGSYHG